jgi:hypothetical protein
MTENQLRQTVVDAINSWIGATKGSANHIDILNTYNGNKPLARGYAVKMWDDYCATTTSAAYIKAGIAAYTGTECGVEKYTEVAKNRGIWVENDAHKPKIGDACVYDWQDNGVGDCTGWADHIGIVTAVNGNKFTVTEGNMSGGVVGTRVLEVNARYIRGFICPNFAALASKMDASIAPTKTTDELVSEVIMGKWGVGSERKRRLIQAGYDYETVQKAVNARMSGKKPVKTIAEEVIRGKWGNGIERKNKLEAAGYNYQEVQREVNKLTR